MQGREYECTMCGKDYTTKANLLRHMKDAHKVKGVRLRSCSQEGRAHKRYQETVCPYCASEFGTKQTLINHIAREVCIKRKKLKELSPREDDKEAEAMTTMVRREKFRSIGVYQVNAAEGQMKILTEIPELKILKRLGCTNFILPVNRISHPMGKYEREGTVKYMLGIENFMAPKKDHTICKSVCSIMDGEHEIKLFSRDISFLPPEMKEGCWCIMCFYGVRLMDTSKTTYMSLDENGGWEILNEAGDLMFGSGNISSLAHDKLIDQSVFGGSLRRATKGDFNSRTMPTPWLTFPIKRSNGNPDQLDNLNGEQRKVANLIMKEIDNVNQAYEHVDRNSINIHFINGLPGTGKSFLLETLYLYCKCRGVNCKMVAFTKMVANMYDEGSTLHAYFNIKFIRGQIEDPDTEANPSRFKLYSIANLRVLFIDEVCCVRMNLMQIVDSCLRKFHNSLVPFGGLLVITAGDFNQLPPVDNNDETGAQKEIQVAKSFSSLDYFKAVKFYKLETPCRIRGKADDRLIKLTQIAIHENVIDLSGHVTKSINKGIEFVYGNKSSWPKTFSEGCTIICLTNRTAFEVNSIILSKLKNMELDKIKNMMKTKITHGAETKCRNVRKLNRIVLELLTEGMPLFCTKNQRDGLANGALVFYKGTVDKNNSKRLILVEPRKSSERIHIVIKGKEDFQFDWGFVMTAHKAQGRTFERVCVVLLDDEAFTHGQMTVVLTRVKSIDDLVIVRRSSKCKNPIEKSIRETAEEVSKRALNRYK